MHSLEGPAAAATNVPHCHLSPDGAHLHQVPTGLDSVDGAWSHGHLGYGSECAVFISSALVK